MASNYRTSAGTDLDSVFYINNSNAGAIGFKVAEGQDLGNRYVSGSLGYNVGLKNSAGTDLGYLRGNMIAPTASVAVTPTYVSQHLASCDGWDPNEGNEGGYCTSKGYFKTVKLNVALSTTNNMPITNADIYLEQYNRNKYSEYLDHYYYANLSDLVPTANGSCNDSDDCMVLSIANYSSRVRYADRVAGYSWVRVGQLGSVSATNFQMTISFFKIDDSCAWVCSDCTDFYVETEHWYDNEFKLRLAIYVRNAVGGSWVTSPEFSREQ